MGLICLAAVPQLVVTSRRMAATELVPKNHQLQFKKIFEDIKAAFPSFTRLQFIKCLSHDKHHFTLQAEDPSIGVTFDIVARECHRTEDEQHFVGETTRYMTTRNVHLVAIVHAGVCSVKVIELIEVGWLSWWCA